MVSSIEREFKTLLTKEQYQQLINYFQLNAEKAIIQTNHYYDTDDSQFKSIKSALRLRIFQDQTSEWTIKQQLNEIDSLELTQHNPEPLSTIPIYITPTLIHAKEMQDFINKQNIHWLSIQPTQSFKTTRYYIESDEGLYALDATDFSHHSDFELELESDDIERGFTQFSALLERFNISYQQSETKLARAFAYSDK
ncbi:CYTH domain-containing protein [Aerococcaceae bacterium WGS1372]